MRERSAIRPGRSNTQAVPRLALSHARKGAGEAFSLVDTNRRIIAHGDIITAGGFLSWVDLCLFLVERILRPAISAETARFALDSAFIRRWPLSYFRDWLIASFRSRAAQRRGLKSGCSGRRHWM